MESAFRTLVGKLEWKRPLGIPRHRWKINSEVDLKDIELEGVDCVHLTHDNV
jgi:hypothetical protein